jgi:hypothetical protein
MRTREAKDFLVQQTAEQAALEGVSLSDLEKRMMYFTETEEMSEDFIKLNDEFEAQYDSEKYESKISRLLRHAHARAKKENSETVRLWAEAIRVLNKGDHYILVLWNESPSEERPPYDSLKLLGTALLVIAVGLCVFALADHYGIHWPSGPKTRWSMPVWLQRLLIGLTVGGYFYYVVLPWILKKPSIGIGQLLGRLLLAGSKSKQGK